MYIKKSDPSLDEVCEGLGSVSHIPVPTGIIKGARSCLTFAYNRLCRKRNKNNTRKLSIYVEEASTTSGVIQNIVTGEYPEGHVAEVATTPTHAAIYASNEKARAVVAADVFPAPNKEKENEASKPRRSTRLRTYPRRYGF